MSKYNLGILDSHSFIGKLSKNVCRKITIKILNFLKFLVPKIKLKNSKN